MNGMTCDCYKHAVGHSLVSFGSLRGLCPYVTIFTGNWISRASRIEGAAKYHENASKERFGEKWHPNTTYMHLFSI